MALLPQTVNGQKLSVVRSAKGIRTLKNLFALLFVISNCASAQVTPLPEIDRSNIEYESPADALVALRSKPGVEISVQGGWTIAYEPASHVIWSFTPEKHAAYPSVIKRAIVEKDGSVFINMDVKCKASKEICDELVRDFIQLNENMRSSMQSKASRKE
jgi:hypothetical protein